MRFGKTALVTFSVALLGVAARGDLASWVQRQPAGSVLDVLLRRMPMPGGPVQFRRPPVETRPALAKLIAAEPKNGDLYRLRAQEAELQLDFGAAEGDWKLYAERTADRGEGYLQLADYYHRRVQAQQELGALQIVGTQPSDRFVPVASQRAWQAYARMLPVIREAGLPGMVASNAYRSWIARYPKEAQPRQEFIGFLTTQEQYAAADAQITLYARALPEDLVYPTEARAGLAGKQKSEDAAITIYDKAFQPLWPKALLEAYFQKLDKNEQLRDFLGRARTAREKNPVDMDATGRLFAYYQHANNTPAAERVLIEYRLAKEAKPVGWSAGELATLAGLFGRVQDANEQARAYYALYSVSGATAADRETALAGMTALLIETPDRPLRFGSGDLSLYKDIATADSSPGILNGILSLVLSSTAPGWQYRQQNGASASYFHRAEGAKLLQLLEKQFPWSSHRAALRSGLVDTYAGYGDDEAAIAAARAFLTAFPKATERTHVGLALADALARKQRGTEEFAVYQQMLTELAARAEGVPLGAYGGTGDRAEGSLGAPRFKRNGFPAPEEAESKSPAPGPRSSEYAVVLDKYLARAAALDRPMDALRIYRRELDRNPNDPGLYERFAGFLEQNSPGAEVQDVYRRAIAKFPDKSWYDKLARWYLRSKQESAFATITREATGIFSGMELEAYFDQVVGTSNIGQALNRQLNLYAHRRFPQDLVFVRNLLTGCGQDSAAADALLHDYWFYDVELKRRYFAELSARGDLMRRIAAGRHEQPEIQNGAWQQLAAANPAALQFNAEAEAWLGHFEAAAPALRAMAELYPGSVEKAQQTSSLYRSLAAYFPADTQVAAAFAQKAYQADPRNTQMLEAVGDVYADKEDFARAALAWDAIPRVFPGKPDGYLEAGTVYWDYYRFNDALLRIRQARTKYRDKTLFAYEAGAVEEGRRDYQRAVDEYLAGSKAGNQEARARLVRLASRPAQRDLIYRMTAAADSALRIDVLKAQQRKPELQAFLAKEIAVATRIGDVGPLVEAAREQGFEAIERQGLEREAAVTLDPVERMRLRIDFAKYLEEHKDVPAAARTLDALYRDNPAVLGVIRARVNFDTRSGRESDAVVVLTEAAANARADLSAQFRFEASRIATNAGQIDQARGLLAELLKSDPYRADYLAQMAETYTASKDDTGFVKFAGAEIETLQKSGLPVEERKARVTALRRRLITTLARRSDYAAAVDQYIEVVNFYPEDEAVTREAALFALGHDRKDQLLSFYSRTVAAAPKDWRWPIVLARLETAVEDYPAALNAYDTAMKARPDRADLVQARAALEERLLRFEDAVRSYTRLYELTYNDPRWLDKAAEFQARLGRGKEAVATLEKAHISASGETVTGLFAIADSLDRWHLANEAARFAQRGFELGGQAMGEKYSAQLNIYARVMASVRRNDAFLGSELPQVTSAGKRVAELYTPEEKADLAGKTGVALPLATAAGLEDSMARLLTGDAQRPQLIALQSRRGLYEDLSRQLLAVANQPNRIDSAQFFSQAASAASRSGDVPAQTAIYARMQSLGLLGTADLNRYLELLLANDPKALVEQSSDQAVRVAITGGSESVAMDSLRARAQGRPPVWLSSYTALTGVYFNDHSPAVNQAFLATLHPRNIGQRLTEKFDADRSLAGAMWFYYGARYGEHLTRGRAANSNDYLPAELELRPGDPEAYLAVAWFDSETKSFSNAIAEFRKALDLDPDRGEAHDGIARVLLQQGRRTEAIAEWRESFAAFEREQNKGVRVRDLYWALVNLAVAAVSDAKAFPDLQPDIHRLLADYVHINGEYRLAELINPALAASYKAGAGFEWLLDVAANSWPELGGNDPGEQEWVARFYLAAAARKATGVNQARASLIDVLLARDKVADALVEWRKFTPQVIENFRRQRNWTEIRIAGAENTMDRLLTQYRSQPQLAPGMQELLQISSTVRRDGHDDAARSLLEFAYTREIEAQHLETAHFLGLARVCLERGTQLTQAVTTLRRMTLVAHSQFIAEDAPFEGFEPAGDLLLEFHHEAEAKEFFAKAVQAIPWNARAKLKLGRAAEVVNDRTAPYTLRAEAARQLGAASAGLTGELGLLAAHNISPDAARKPFYVESRLAAAAAVSDAAVKLSLLREALAIAPDDSRVRLAVVHAALNAHNDRLGLATYQAAAGAVYTPQSVRDNDQPQAEPEQVSGPTVAADAALLNDLSLAAERVGDLTAAIGYAGYNAPERVARLRAEQKRRVENSRRAPVITGKPEQTHVVRPRDVQ